MTKEMIIYINGHKVLANVPDSLLEFTDKEAK